MLQSCLTLCNSINCDLPGSSAHGIFPGKNTGVGCHFLRQGIFPTQGSNLGLLHRRQILYRLSHQGSPDLPLLQIISQMATRGQTGVEHCLKINKPSLGRTKSFFIALTLPFQSPILFFPRVQDSFHRLPFRHVLSACPLLQDTPSSFNPSLFF